MSGATSSATGKKYGIQRVCAIWEFARSTLYNSKQKEPLPKDNPGPKPKISDGELEERIGADLESSPFCGEGHRKVWARLRRQGMQPPSCAKGNEGKAMACLRIDSLRATRGLMTVR